MAQQLAKQLDAAHAQIHRLSAMLEERDNTVAQRDNTIAQRDNTISQLLQEVHEHFQTVALQAQTIYEQEAVTEAPLSAAGRVPSGRSQPDSSNTSRLISPSTIPWVSLRTSA